MTLLKINLSLPWPNFPSRQLRTHPKRTTANSSRLKATSVMRQETHLIVHKG